MRTGWMRGNPWLKQIAPICSHWLPLLQHLYGRLALARVSVNEK